MSTNKYGAQDSNRGIIRSTSVISLGTLSSRILGFLRDIILAKLMGTGLNADAFFVAFRIPNLFRDMVGEGATNSALVPVFSEYKEKKSRMELWNFVSVIFISSLMILSLITICGIVFAPYIVRLIAPGFIEDPHKLDLTIHLTRIMFPYLIFIGLTAYCMGLLYTFRSFYSPAFSPCLLNISIIGSALVVSRSLKEPVFGLAAGVLIGGVAQLAVQIVPLMKQGIKIRRPKSLAHPGAIKAGKLLIPRLFGAAVYQLTIFIDTFCASLSFIIGAGGISAIYYANRIIQFPMGIISVALASAILPTLSGFAVRKDIEHLRKTLLFSLKNIIFVMLPIGAFILLLSTPIIRILFQRGEFGVYSTTITSSALMFYCIGLVSYGGIKILVTAFHSLQDTKTPVRVAVWCLVINTVLNFILMWRLKVGGIALASAIAATIDFAVLLFLIDKRVGSISRDIIRHLVKVFCATLVMVATVDMTWRFVSVGPEIVRLLCTGFAGLIIFLLVAITLRIDQAQSIRKWILKKR